MSVASTIRRSLNVLPGFKVVPDTEALWWKGPPRFSLGGHDYRCFCHSHNCGWPTSRMTERAIEMAIADRWLGTGDGTKTIEIGAVTPYYWPGRVGTVVDPVDEHPKVTHPQSVFDVDLRGYDVLSISTLEHIGLGDYLPPVANETCEGAFEKIRRESRRFLVTVPFGLNPAADEFFFSDEMTDVRYMVRDPFNNWWIEVRCAREARRPYGKDGYAINGWANGLAILHRDVPASAAPTSDE